MDKDFRQTRTGDGHPMPGLDANAADVIALLSGVNLGSIIKVLIALDALKVATGLTTDQIVAPSNLPEFSPWNGDSQRGEHRIRATQHLAQNIATDTRLHAHDAILRMRGRI